MTIKELCVLFGQEAIVSDLEIKQALPSDKYPDRFRIQFNIDKKNSENLIAYDISKK